MKQRNKSLLVAVCVLNALVKSRLIKVNTSDKYDWYEFKALADKGKCPESVLKDAIALLFINGHIEVQPANYEKANVSHIKATTKGSVALTEKYYEEDIRDYNEKRWVNFRSWVALIISAVAIILSILKSK